MTNILSSQNMDNNNIIPARNLSFGPKSQNDSYRAVLAPADIPKYSMYKELEERDEFRRNVLANSRMTQINATKRKNNLLKIGVILSTVAGFFLLKGKK